MDPRPGRCFADRYDVVALLGEGGMGAVYHTHDRAVGVDVALKVLRPTRGGRQDVERFRREVRLARRITHRNVVRIHDLGSEEGLHFLTMELVTGVSLDCRLRAGALLPNEVAVVGAQICAGLIAAHEAGVIHRDLKPSNVLLEDGGRVVLTDFGIARALESPSECVRTDGVLGTPYYLAPEQVMGEAVDARTDIYSLGVMLYELLTGRVPFDAPTPMAAALARLTAPAPDPRSLAQVPDAVAELVLGCLARNPAERHASAREVERRLEALIQWDAPTVEMERPTVRPAPPAEATTGLARPWRMPSLAGLRTLAVLPFRYHGPPGEAFLGPALAEELIDVLSRTQGLRVLAAGATESVGDLRDPRAVGRALGADLIVDGRLALAGGRVRTSARMIEASTGVQTWSERFEGEPGDLIAMQERMSLQIAETLRLEILLRQGARGAPAEAVALYLEARRPRAPNELKDGGSRILALFEQCLSLAPEMKVAVAGYALATLRAWFFPIADPSKDWAGVARERVDLAMLMARDLAETHLAQAMLATQLGGYAGAVAALREALRIAPTYAQAIAFLAMLQGEAGQPDLAIGRHELALELDPTLSGSLMEIARINELLGRPEEADRALERMERGTHRVSVARSVAALRIGTWRRDAPAIRRALAELPSVGGRTAELLNHQGRVATGDGPVAEATRWAAEAIPRMPHARMRTMAWQVMVELSCMDGDLEQAMAALRRAADEVLVDVLWLDRCRLLGPIRGHGPFSEVRRRVRERAASLWAG